jgi:hypothetical protein
MGIQGKWIWMKQKRPFPVAAPGSFRVITQPKPPGKKEKYNMSQKLNLIRLILPLLACLGLTPMAQAVGPDTDGNIPPGNNGEGVGVLVNLTTGIWNTGTGFEALNQDTAGQQNTATGLRALTNDTSGGFNTATGVYALFANMTGFFNVATGAYSLAHNTNGLSNTANGYSALYFNTEGDENTATGAAALYKNTTGFGNNAVGSSALADNRTGDFNNAHGRVALSNATTGTQNNAFGDRALLTNVTGSFNTAVGDDALLLSPDNDSHVCVGDNAGSGITTADNNIIIGHHNGVHSVFGQISDRTFIDNIHGAPVSAGTALAVLVDADGRLGTTTAAGADPGGFSSQPAQPYVPDRAKQALLNRKVETLQTTLGQQQKQIEILTAQLKEQAAQIQKVSAPLETSKPASKVVVNTPENPQTAFLRNAVQFQKSRHASARGGFLVCSSSGAETTKPPAAREPLRRPRENKAFDKATFFFLFVLDTFPRFLAERLPGGESLTGRVEQGRGRVF